MKKSKRVILHYDMDAFYASIEIRDQPNLSGKPVIVGTSVITTCNYEARKYGLHSAMSVTKARGLCPYGIYLKVDKEKYSRVSKQIKNLVLKLTNKVEFIALDEGFVDITEIIKNYPSYEIFADKFQRGILKNTGLTCSIGIGYNKLSAKLASDAKKPGGVTFIKNLGEFADFMSDKGVKLIPGVGKKTQEILGRKSITQVSDVLKMSLQELRSILGYNRGEMIYEYCRGIDNRKVSIESKTHSISNERTYSTPLEDREFIWSEFLNLLVKTHKRLKQQKFHTKTLTLKVRYLDRKTITRSKSIYISTQSIENLKKLMVELFEEINLENKIKLLGVNLGNLSENKEYQLSFKDVGEIKKERKIQELKDKINNFKN
ncbi:DNA polymerase IV [Psychrilyobacter atlanticus]|uniref:DNA polymerase IV n=1 Tax=Psychrilyobacter atlanticus TaxID=271091 RepID=UPI000418F80F|nr:DNA polymerase IV [Psychrilyobacter atlanticus]